MEADPRLGLTMEVLSAYGVGGGCPNFVQQAILKQDLHPGNDWV